MKNTFQIIHIIGSMQGLFIFILLVMRKRNKLANRVFALLIFLITISLLTAFFHTNNDEINDFIAICRSDMFIFFYGPLIAFYTLFLTGFKERLKPGYFFHLCPAVVLLVLLISYYIHGENLMFFGVFDNNSHFAFRFWYVINSAALFHLLAYIVYGLIIAYKYKKQLASYFSQKDRIYLLWLRVLLTSIVFICLLAIIQFVMNPFHDSEGVLQWTISITVVLLIFVMGYFTNRQPDILEDLKDMNQLLTDTGEINDDRDLQLKDKSENEDKKGKYVRNRMEEAEERENLNKLLKYVEEQKPYLTAELNLKQLSDGVGIPGHRLSMLLSIYLNQNFYTFINKYRVEEAKKRLAALDSKEHNILTIAFDTGFNSKSTFNTVFKKFEGITPSEYRTINLNPKRT